MNSAYHQAITVMPNGQIFAGEHESAAGYPKGAPLLGMYKKDRKTGLIAKTFTNKKLTSISGALAAKWELGEAGLLGATTIADQTNISHLQLIRLFPELQGTPTEYFYLDNAFVSRDVPQLELRETFYDTTASAQYKGRLEESKATKTNFDEILYNLSKLTDKAYTPIEDLMKTIINPQTVDLGQIAWGFKYKRNQSAAAALATITNNLGDMDDPTMLDTTGFHSKYHVATELNTLFNTFLKTNDVQITDTIWNPQDFTAYSENTWTVSGPAHIEPIRLAGGGVVPLPGIPGVRAIVDVAVPQGTIYAINKPNALRLGEGPKITRRYYDEERDAEVVKFIDFHEYLAVEPQLKNISRKFAGTITILSGS